MGETSLVRTDAVLETMFGQERQRDSNEEIPGGRSANVREQGRAPRVS
jgi:hypothetical protein